MSQRDSTLLLKPALLVMGAIVMAVVVTLAVNGLLAFTGFGFVGQQPVAANGSGGGGGVMELPGEWGGNKWYSEDYREDGFKYKDPEAGKTVKFSPKKMNN